MAAIMVKLECLTNMHVGNGDVNFNIIDNEVERDVTTGYPTINASGVKGALREFFKKEGVEETTINSMFGNPEQGKLKFLSADMFAIPMRASEGKAAYYLVSTEVALDNYNEKCKLFLNSGKEIKFNNKVTANCSAESYELSEMTEVDWGDTEKSKNKKVIYFMEHEKFKRVNLPVIARNKIAKREDDNANLWYEEVVPHKALFTFVVLAEDVDQTELDNFAKKINGKIVQFGGNASIGYGLCKVSVVKKEA